MIGFLGFVFVWFLGWCLSWPGRLTLALTTLWWAVLVLVSAPEIGLPGVAAILGGSFHLWVLAAPAALIALAYRDLIKRLRSKAQSQPTAPPPPDPESLSPAEIERYARHIYLRDIGGQGQLRLKRAKVLVVGAGGLGAPALLYLSGAGVGVIGVIDDDRVELTNLQRQIIHSQDRIGMPKVFSAELAMRALNPHVEIRPYHRHLDEEVAAALIADYDLVLDGSDNFDTRYLVNRVCAALGKPLIAGAIGQWEGQLALYDPAQGGACYECIFPERPAEGLVPSCAEAGVVAALPGVIGTMMALEAIKQLTGAGETLRGRLLIQDGLYGESRVIRTAKRADCAACGKG